MLELRIQIFDRYRIVFIENDERLTKYVSKSLTDEKLSLAVGFYWEFPRTEFSLTEIAEFVELAPMEFLEWDIVLRKQKLRIGKLVIFRHIRTPQIFYEMNPEKLNRDLSKKVKNLER